MSRAAYIRPSSAATWVVCTGNIDMRAMFPDAPDEADTEITEDGTACHWLANEIWNGRFHQEGSLSPNGRVLTDEMFEAVDVYHDYLRTAMPRDAWVCERELAIDYILQGMRGTPDAFAIDHANKVIYIADLKFGFRFVEVWENWQMICYFTAVVQALQAMTGNLYWQFKDQEWTVQFCIIQPRSNHRDGPVRVWRTNASNLRAQINLLQNAAQHATEYVPNSGCTDCPGRHVCVALQNSSLRALEVSYGGEPYELNPAALGDELRRLKDAEKKITARITGLEAQADALLRRGATVPGWVLAATYARETWREGTEQQIITMAREHFKTDITKPARAITPNQARKLLPAAIVATFACRPSTGVRLTKQDPYEARKVFENEK